MKNRIQIYESRNKRVIEIKAAKEATRERLLKDTSTKQHQKSEKERLRQLRIEERNKRIELRLNGHPPEKPKRDEEELNFYAAYLVSNHWRKRRQDYLNKYPQCCICGTYLNLNIHHIWYKRDGKSILYRERDSDLRTLCKRDHKKIHYHKMEKLFHNKLTEEAKLKFINLPDAPILVNL